MIRSHFWLTKDQFARLKPLLPNDDTSRWTALAKAGSFRETVASFVGGHGWVMGLPFLLPVVAALVFAVFVELMAFQGRQCIRFS